MNRSINPIAILGSVHSRHCGSKPASATPSRPLGAAAAAEKSSKLLGVKASRSLLLPSNLGSRIQVERYSRSNVIVFTVTAVRKHEEARQRGSARQIDPVSRGDNETVLRR